MAEVVTGDGCRLNYRFDGAETAPVLLLSNSLGADLSMWEPQMAAWTKQFRVLRYDQRGHGGSDAPAGAYSLDRLGRDVLELLDTLNLGVVDFCGLSLGGMVGQWLGVRAPERLNRLVLANTSAFMGPPSGWDARIALARDQGVAPLAQASIERWFTPEFIAAGSSTAAGIAATFEHTNPAGYAGCCAAIRDMDLRPFASLIKAPTLVIGGLKDPSTPPPHSEALTAAISSARLEMLDAAHLSNVEQPAAFSALVLAHLTVTAPHGRA
ncbi:MAG: 3-oxoadipate enol-lactonase [Alphaproteobacteria bacterium]|jgi:3-oxoadipate enol-lactonase|nr:3-oxoadipate enol-lactonase [Alphaproteobacteria bacterium]